LACIGVLFSPAGFAGDRSVSIRWAGTGMNQVTDTIDGGHTVNMIDAQAKGSLGNAAMAITNSWVPAAGDCPAAYIPLTLGEAIVVMTAPDRSQLFGYAATGWMCLDPMSGEFYGEASGNYTGGTGRFHGATGNWLTEFDGVNLSPDLNLIAIKGDVDGTLVTQ